MSTIGRIAEDRSNLVGIRTILQVVELERRETPSGTRTWPITPPNGQTLDLAETYGQFSASGALHFHEGIDILAPSGTSVTAIDSGRISAFNPMIDDPQKVMEINYGGEGSTRMGWQYLHILPGVNRANNDNAYQKGDLIAPADDKTGRVSNMGIGVVSRFGNAAWKDHLHLAFGQSVDPFKTDQNGTPPTPLFRPTRDPLEMLTPIGDTVAPTVNAIHFRAGSWDRLGILQGGTSVVQSGKSTWVEQSEGRVGIQRYFVTKERLVSSVIVVGANAPTADMDAGGLSGDAGIDIVADAYDQIKANGEYKLGVKSIGFWIYGVRVKSGSSWGVDKSFDFTGEFAPDEDLGQARQSYVSLRNAQQVRAVYTNDLRFPSQDGKQYFYTVTNRDSDLLVQAADRDRQWFSKKTAGSAWNNGAAADAANNARGEWPDDYYDIAVTARDETAKGDVKTQRVLLDNWTQTLTATLTAQGVSDDSYTFTGSQFTANATVKIYLVTAQLAAGASITGSGGILLGTATTDADGNIVAATFAAPRVPPWQTLSLFLADYHNGDDVYQPQLDATSAVEVHEDPPLLRAGGDAGAAADFTAASSAEPIPAAPGHQAPPPKSGTVPATVAPVEAPPDAKRSELPTPVAALPGVAPLAAFALADWSGWGGLGG